MQWTLKQALPGIDCSRVKACVLGVLVAPRIYMESIYEPLSGSSPVATARLIADQATAATPAATLALI